MDIQRSTLVAKAQELMKTEGLDGAAAARKARDTMTPVTATSQINQDQLAKNQALRQAPATPIAPAPNTPALEGTTTPNGATLNSNGTIANAPLPTEQQINAQYGGVIQDNGINSVQPKIEQAPVKQPEPVKQVASAVTQKTEAPIDYTQAKGRESEITANLDSFKAKGMTPDEIMRASDYQNASPEKKALIEPYLKQQVPTASAMYNAIVGKADIPDDQKTSLPYKIANNRYMKANMYSTMTPSQLSSEMTNSKLIQGSQAYEDLKAMNPKLVQDTENLRIVNGSKQNVFTYTNNPDGTSTKVNNLEKNFADDFNDNFGEIIKQMYQVQTPEQIRAIIRTPDVVAAEEKATALELEMNELEKQIDAVDKSVEEEMKGTGASGNRIALEKSIRKEQLQKDYNSVLKNYTTYANKANNLITQNTTLYTTQQQQKQAQNAAMLPFITDQYKTEQEKIKAEEALKDPATAIKSVMDEYKKLGIPFTSTPQSRLAEFEASGLSLPDYLTKMGQNIQESPAYKQYEAQQAGKGISYQTIGDSVYRKNADGSLTKTNIDPTKTTEASSKPVWQEWTDANGVKHAEWLTPGVNPTTSTGVKPTGNIVPVTAGNKTVRLDQVGATGFESAISQLTSAGIPVVVGQGARDQTATIKSMADRYGITFNASNPAETAQKLRSAGHQVADPGKSNHESGMAIDVYGDSKLGKVSTEQEKILNANGWYSAGIPGDAGHFEYRGGGAGTQSNTKIGGLGQFMKDNQDRGTGYSNDDVKAFNEKIDRLVSAGDEKGMAIAYRNMVMKDKDFKKEFDDTKSFTTALDTVQKLVDDYEKSGKSTNALTGLAEKMYRKLGMTKDEALAQLQTQMGTTMANYIKSISGTAASDAEVQRLMGNMANIGNVKDLNTAIISQVKQNALNGIKSMIDTRMYGMPDELKPQVFGDVYGTTSTTKNEFLSSIKSIGESLAKGLSGIK